MDIAKREKQQYIIPIGINSSNFHNKNRHETIFVWIEMEINEKWVRQANYKWNCSKTFYYLTLIAK